MSKYNIYTDGSSRGNPGPGGWGVVVMDESNTQIIFTEHDSDEYVTNNRMELKAMLCALGYAESHPKDQFTIYSDSVYVVNSCNIWRHTWALNGWKNAKKQPVENLDLQKCIHDFLSRDFFNAEILSCKGHQGEVGNELADALATNNKHKYQELVSFWELQ